MAQLTNLLRQRLRLREAPGAARETLDCGTTNGDGTGSVAGAVVHPDADTLTAYAERLLGAVERGQIVRHLAICGECRDIVLLAWPEAETAAKAPVAVPVVRGWRALFTPRLGLAASAVAAALVVGLIVESPWKSTRTTQNPVQAPNANSTPSINDASKQVLTPPAPSLVPATPSLAANPSANPSLLDSKDLKAAAVRSKAKAATRSPLNLASNAAPAARGQEAREVYDLRNTASTVSSAPPANIAGVVTGERRDYLNAAIFAPASTFDGSGTDSGAGVAKKELPVAPVAQVGNPWNTIPSTQIPDFSQLSSVPGANRRTFAPPRQPGRSFVGFVMSPAEKFFQRRPPLSAHALGFNNTMGGNGQLNPAKDKSESVEVMAAAPLVGTEADLSDSPAFSERARSKALAGGDAEYGGSSSSWKVVGGRLLKRGEAGSWIEAYPAEGIEFSTFSAHGLDVWAGGHEAALVHSSDAGTTWERITLGAAASGTIVRIEAKGLSVQVVSSSGQSWTSVDGGKTWARED